jgi:xylulose-5-phosphate/fructose-6-phosphate phosphoketolase
MGHKWPPKVTCLQVRWTLAEAETGMRQVRTRPDQLALLEQRMHSYKPEEQFDRPGRLAPDLAALAPRGDRRMGANPHANAGRLLVDLDLPDFRDYRIEVPRPGAEHHESTRRLGQMLRAVYTRNARQANFRLFCPNEINSNRLGAIFEVENRCFVGKTISIDDHVSADGRVLEVLSEHLCEGWLEGYTLTGRHGLYVTYASRNVASAIVLELLIVERGYQPSVAAGAGDAVKVGGSTNAARAKTRMQHIHQTICFKGDIPSYLTHGLDD